MIVRFFEQCQKEHRVEDTHFSVVVIMLLIEKSSEVPKEAVYSIRRDTKLMLSDGEKRKKVFKIHREIDVVSHTTWQFHSQFTSVYSVKYRLFCRLIHFIFGIFVFIINFCKMWAIYCLDEIFENRKKTIENFFVIVRSIGKNFFSLGHSIRTIFAVECNVKCEIDMIYVIK